MSLKTLKACGDLVHGALAVFEARNRLRGVIDAFKASNGLKEISAEALAVAFPSADESERARIFDCASRLETAFAALNKIADSLPANDLPARP